MAGTHILPCWGRVESDELVRLRIHFRRTKVFGRNIRIGDVYLGSAVHGVGRCVVVADPCGQVASQGSIAKTNRSYLDIDEVNFYLFKWLHKYIGKVIIKRKNDKRI